MLENVAQIIQEFIKYENKRLNEFNITHGPTIGKMYEGLSIDILSKVIPKNLNLKVVSGFIYDDTNEQSGQIDCMLVTGDGFKIPHTNDFKCHINDVIAVLEVKKTLYTKDLIDSFEHLKSVLQCLDRQMERIDKSKYFEATHTYRLFSEVTGIILPDYESVNELPYEYKMIFHSLQTEQLMPVRIIWGYNGFKSELDMRRKFVSFIENNQMKRSYGIKSIPQLILSGQTSLVKLNGLPYCSKLRNGWWPFLTTSRENPIKLLLEFIWTKIEQKFKVSGFWGEDLLKENLHPFLEARIKKENQLVGWDFNIVELTKEELNNDLKQIEWEPVFLTEAQYKVICLLCKNSMDQSDTKFLDVLRENSLSKNEFIESLIETGLVGVEGSELKLITQKCECVLLPDAKYVAAENNTGRLTRWVEKYYSNQL